MRRDEQPKDEAHTTAIAERIAERYPDLSPQLRSIAEFSIANLDAMAVETARTLAERMHVPPSSLVRFAQELGYRGFSDMKREFRDLLMYRLAETREREAIRGQAGTGAVAVVDALISEARRSIDKLAKELDRTRFDRAVIELAAADRLHVAAQQASYPLGCLFHWTVICLGQPCHLLDHGGGFGPRQAELLGKDDALLAISFPPYQAQVVQTAKAHAAGGGLVVAVTDTILSPLAEVARITVETPQQMPSTAHPLTAAATVVQALAIALGETWSRPDDDPSRR